MKRAMLAAIAAMGMMGLRAELLIKDGETIAFMGDSITDLGNQPAGYVNMVMKGLELAGVKNAVKIPAGVGGHKAVQMHERLERDVLKRKDGRKPQWMTFSCGVNDVWHSVRGAGVPLEKYRELVGDIFDRCAAAGVKVMVLTPTLIQEDPDNALNRQLDAYVDWIKAEAAKRKLPVADLNAAMKAELAKLKAADPSRGNKLTVDGVHMAYPGNCMMAWEILKVMGVEEGKKAEIFAAFDEMPAAYKETVFFTANEWKKVAKRAKAEKKDVRQYLHDVAGYAPDANPIFDGWYADPQIRLYGDTYWVFPTYSADFNRQTFFDAFSSKDLKNWTKHEKILTTKEVKWAKRAMWAPDAHEKDGKYYLFFGANDAYPVDKGKGDLRKCSPDHPKYGGIGVAVADKPEGPYRDLIGKPLIDEFWNVAQPIDQYVFQYKGGWYMVYGGWRRCNIVKLADDFKSIVPLEDGKMYKEITPWGYVEGSVMFERNGVWYFMYSSGNWTQSNYCVMYATAETPFGPFKHRGKILGIDEKVATGAGHHSVVRLPGTDRWLICYHRRPLNNQSPHHRVTCIDEMKFDAEGNILPVKMTFTGPDL